MLSRGYRERREESRATPRARHSPLEPLLEVPVKNSPALQLAGLEKSHRSGFALRRRPVLSGVDLSVARGERLGLLGPNGSGKSTLLRIAAGVDRADAGTVRVLDGSPGEAAVRRRLGWLPEDSPFPRELGGCTALALCASVRGLPRPRAHALAWLERLGLADAARTPLGRYSRGMLRRFGLAQAFFHEPDLVLLDEPTAGLDAQGHVALHELLDDARARGAGIVLASHVPADVFGGCDRAAVLLDGRIAVQGAPRELLGDDGRRVLELEGLPAARLAAARDALAGLGVRIVGELPSTNAVLDLYRDPLRRGGRT